jgi:uncharacterized protein (TIGR03382 family)
MRRAPLLAALAVIAAPSLALAQDLGVVTFDNAFISSTECAGSGSIQLTWRFDQDQAFPTGGSIQVFATNQDFEGPSCPTNGSPEGRVVNQVGATITTARNTESFSAREFVIDSGQSCSDDATIWVCVQLKSTTSNVGFAKGTLTVSAEGPSAPVGVGVSPGDRALNVSWSPGDDTDTPEAVEYEVIATVDPDLVTTSGPTDPNSSHSSGRTSKEDTRLEGLVNGVTYKVVVFAYSLAGNQSAASEEQRGTPQPVDDFWDSYVGAGGREQGGCATGSAGTLALLAAAAALAVLRRRK